MPPTSTRPNYKRRKDSKAVEVVGDVKHFINGQATKVKEEVGPVVRKVSGKLKRIREDADFIMQATADDVRHALTPALDFVESGLNQVVTTGVQTQIGTKVAGIGVGMGFQMKLGGGGPCADLMKFVKDVMKFHALAKKLMDKLKLAGVVPGLGPLIKEMNKLMQIQLPCLDISAGASAEVDAKAVFDEVADDDMAPETPPP